MIRSLPSIRSIGGRTPPAGVRGFVHRFVTRLVALIALATASAFAQESAAPEMHPPDAALFVQITGLDRQLARPEGKQFQALLRGLGLFDRTSRSWFALAEALELDSETAISALLGGRFLLLADGLEDPSGPVRWACAMSIDADLVGDLPRLLKAAPRDSLNGRTVYAIEDGRLSVMPVAGTNALAVATRDAKDLLVAAANLATGRESGNAGPMDSGVLVLRRDDGSALSGTITPVPGGWDFRCSLIEPEPGVRGPRDPREIPVRIEPAWYEEATREAAVAYAGPLLSGAGDRAPAGEHSLLGPGLPGTEPSMLRKWVGVFMPVQPPVAFLQGGSDVGVLAAGEEGSASAWFRVPDPLAAAREGDTHLCAVLDAMGRGQVVSLDAPECTGGFPAAIRSITLPGDLSGRNAETRFTWGVSSMRDRSAGEQAWWSMHAQPPGSVPRDRVPRLSMDPSDPEIRFTIRPRRLVGRLETPEPAGGAPVGVASLMLAELTRLDLVDWTLTPSPVPGFPATGMLRLRFAIDD